MRARRLLLLGLLLVAPAEAHEGPPYPIFVDRETRYGRLSTWGDPDEGTGTFWITLQPAAGARPGDVAVSVAVEPADGHRPLQTHDAPSIRSEPDDRRFQCQVPFDARGAWSLRVAVSGARGRDEVEARVEVTPPGQGPVLDFILYGFPFAAVGGLFILAMVRRRRGYAGPR